MCTQFNQKTAHTHSGTLVYIIASADRDKVRQVGSWRYHQAHPDSAAGAVPGVLTVCCVFVINRRTAPR